MKIFTFLYGTYDINVQPDDTIFIVKQKLEQKNPKLEINLINLVHAGIFLQNKNTLKDLKINPLNNTLICLLKIKKGNKEYYSSKELEELKKKKEQEQKIPINLNDFFSDSFLSSLLPPTIPRQQTAPAPPPQRKRKIPTLFTIGKKVLSEENIMHLKSMGFNELAVIRALFLNENNLEEAVNYILRYNSNTTELSYGEYTRGCKYFGDFELEDCIKKKKCTFTVTKQEFAWQKWYSCKTCGLLDGKGMCESCKEMCHSGHEVTVHPPSSYCDCGAGVAKDPCKCL